MNSRSTASQLQGNDSLVVIAHRCGSSWRCLFATIHDNEPPTLEDVIEVDSDSDLDTVLTEKAPNQIFSILPGSSTVCRTTTLPDVDEEQILEALRLQAEAKLLGSTPTHRRGMAPLESAIGETNRIGLIVSWPESSKIDIPTCLADGYFIPDAASIAALLDGLRPTEPLLLADPSNGTVTLALSHANGAALRATREDYSSTSAFSQGIIRITRETASLHNHTASFTDGLIDQLQSALNNIGDEIPLVLLPSSVIDNAAKQLVGAPKNDQAWWRTWGIAVGGLLAATGPLQALTVLQQQAPVLHPTVTQRWIQRGSTRQFASRLVIAALLVVVFGPTILSGVKLGLLELMHPNLEAQYEQSVEARKLQVVYKELGKSAWPMTKIIADVINNVPNGIDIDSIRIDVGDPISIRGTSRNEDGKSAAELIALMQENLQSTGVFKDIQFAYDPAGTYGDREFDLWATVIDPMRRPRYTTEQDFGKWTLAMRQEGIQPDDIPDVTPVTVVERDDDGGSPLEVANIGSRSTPTPPFVDDGDSRDRPRRNRLPISDGTGAGTRSTDPNAGGSTSRIPEPLTPGQIDVMSEDEARIALKDVSEGLRHVGRSNDETKTRLRTEMRLLLNRLKEVQR
jgi:hypothetical protein